VGVGVSISLAETALALLAARWLWRLAHGRARPGWPLVWPLAAFALTTALAAMLSARPGESLGEVQKLLLLGGIWVLRDAVPDARAARRALMLLLAVVGVVSVVGILQVTFCAELAAWTPLLGRITTKCHRAHAFYSIYMTLGGVLAVALLATLPGVMASRGRPLWTPAAWLVGLVGLAVTFVRGAWVGFAAGVLILAASIRRGRRLLLGGVVALSLGLLLLPGVRDRVRSIADPSDPTSSERVHMWRSGLAMARDHRLTGVGPRQVGRVYPDYAAPEVIHKHRRALHSTPIQILVERGVLGLAAWAAIFVAFFARVWPLARRLDAAGDPRHPIVSGAQAAVTGFLVAGLTEYNFGDSEVLLAVILVMSLPLAIESGAARSEIGAG
jgi:O-antigen ligase